MSPFLHIKSLFISVLVHIAVHELLHFDGVDDATPRNLGETLLHDLLVTAPGNLLLAVEGVQDRLYLLDDAFLPLERIACSRLLLMTSLREDSFLAPLHNLYLGRCPFIDTRDCLFVVPLFNNLLDDAPLIFLVESPFLIAVIKERLFQNLNASKYTCRASENFATKFSFLGWIHKFEN